LDITSAVREYAEKKAGKLLRYYRRIQEIEVILEATGSQHSARMIVNAENNNMFVAEVTNEDLYASVDLVVDKLERQLTRHKEKTRDKKRPGGKAADQT
jgi:putative sigma-54 modulation protein